MNPKHDPLGDPKRAAGVSLKSATSAREPLGNVVRRALLLPPERASELLWDDQRERWERGEPLPVEAYVAEGEGAFVEAVVLDLIYGERRLRQRGGTDVAPDAAAWTSYQERFPHLAFGLQRQEEFESVVEELFDAPGSTTGEAADATLDSSSVNSRPRARDVAADPAAAPARIGKYVLIGKIDSGAQADVYRAAHPGLQREVVIKLARHVCPVGDPWRERLPAEGRVLAELDHPGLARVYDLDFHGDRPYLVMEYVRGCNLEQQLRRRKPTASEAAQLVLRISETLAVAHERGVLHLDIKPHNILVDEAGNPRLIDFGLARVSHAWTSDARESEGISGTIPYMSPEQARGEEHALTAQSDLYSLGGVLFFLLTGRAPLEGPSVTDLLGRAIRGDWNRILLETPEIPVPLRRVCERAMAPQLSQRYASAHDLIADLRRLTRAGAPLINSLPAIAIASFVVVAGVIGVWLAIHGVMSENPATNRSANSHGTQAQDGSTASGVSANRHASLSTTLESLSALVRVRVWPSGNATAKFQDLDDSLPLHPGDEISIHAEIPPGHHAALIACNNTDGLRVLSRLDADAAQRIVRFPAEESQTTPLEGPPGTEVIALCIQHARPITNEEMKRLWQMDEPWRPLPGARTLQIDPQTLKLLQANRGFGAPRTRVDDEELLRRQLIRQAERLTAACDYFEILAIPCTAR